MTKPAQWFGQAVAYLAFAALIAYLSNAPAYSPLLPGQALIKMSFSHAGRLKGECRELSAKEIAGYAPNMRRPKICPRERQPVLIELELDGQPLLHSLLQPSGLWGDGAATIYRTFKVPSGHHHLAARLRDSDRTTGYDYQGEAELDLAAQQNFVVEFSSEHSGFSFK
jgi:hypothetical protein